MNASQLFADIETGALTEVARAANSYDDQVRGVRVHQSFYIYPNDKIVALNSRDGGYEVIEMHDEDDIATFRHIYKEYFN